MSKDPSYLAILQDYYAEQGAFPPYSTIGKLLGLRSKSSVAALVDRLKQSGHLLATADRRLKPGPRFFERTIRGHVRAGLPESAEDVFLDPLSLDRFLVQTPSRTILIQVKGDSMIGAGIHSGDLAVVERGTEAHEGDLVVAWVDNEYTLKYLVRQDSKFILRPANPDYRDIQPRGQLEIFGVVKGLVRRYD